MQQLESYAYGQWIAGTGGDTIRNAVTGDPVCTISSKGLDYAAMLQYGRRVGGPALRAMTIHQRCWSAKRVTTRCRWRREPRAAIPGSTSKAAS